MIKRKCFQTICFSAALSLLLQAKSETLADSFLNPARGAYSTDKTLDRPFLQSSPIPRVWQTDSSSEEFRNALRKGLSPETRQERLLDASLWQDRATGFQTDFRSIVIKGQRKDLTDVADVLEYLIPVVRNGSDAASEEIQNLNYRYGMYLDKREVSDISKWKADLSRDHAYVHSLDKMMPLYLEMNDMEKYLAEKGRRETEIALDFFNVSLGHSEDIYFSETRPMKATIPLDEAAWALMFNDLLDMSTGINTLMFDEIYRAGDKKENINRSASLLDSDEKTDHIQEDGFKESRRVLIERLKKKTQKKVKKDVK